jgi:hypothetical protein
LKAAIRVGINIKDYEEMTPHQLNLHVLDYNKRKKSELEEKLVLTYLGAYWQRVKRMPSIKKVIGENQQAPKKMTPDEVLEEVKKMNTALGGTTY